MTDKAQALYKQLYKTVKYRPITLRDYQLDCVQAIMAQPEGARCLVIMATGLGKTATFTHLPEQSGRTLIIAAGKEIVLNPLPYYPKDVSVAIEMGELRAKEDKPDARIVTASINTIANPKRLQAFDPEEFDTIIVDEAHHSTAKTYRKVIEYFKPKRLIGFTATADRADGARLDRIYEKIIFQRDLKWAIKHGFLTDIMLRKVQCEFDLRNIRAKKSSGEAVADFTDADLAKAMAKTAPMIVKIYNEYAFGPTIINVAGVALAHEIADLIPDAIAITGDMTTEERQQILSAFAKGQVSCLVNVGVLKEGVDLPAVMSVLMCRPTLSSLLYTQLIGRGLRLYKGKQYLNLIEIEGILGDNVTLCSAPMLFGVKLDKIPKKEHKKFSGHRLTEMVTIAQEIMEEPENWELSTKNALVWADSEGYDMSDVCWMIMPDGHFELTFPGKKDGDAEPPQYRLYLTAPDIYGRVMLGCMRMPLQMALDVCRWYLDANYKNQDYFWDNAAMLKKWGAKPPTDKQMETLKRLIPEMDMSQVKNAAQASMLISKQIRRLYPDGREYTMIYPIDQENEPPYYSGTEVIMNDEQPMTVYDYMMGPEYGYLDETEKGTVIADFAVWLTDVMRKAYLPRVCSGSVDLLIEEIINKKHRDAMAKAFFKSKTGRKYRYVQKMDGVVASRMDMVQMLAETADFILPAIVWFAILNGDSDSEAILKGKVDLDAEPLNKIRFEYAGTEHQIRNLGKHRRRMTATMTEIKEANKKRWLKKQKEKKKTHKC